MHLHIIENSVRGVRGSTDLLVFIFVSWKFNDFLAKRDKNISTSANMYHWEVKHCPWDITTSGQLTLHSGLFRFKVYCYWTVLSLLGKSFSLIIIANLELSKIACRSAQIRRSYVLLGKLAPFAILFSLNKYFQISPLFFIFCAHFVQLLRYYVHTFLRT